MTVREKPPTPGQPGFVSHIPDSAPFSAEQHDCLNGFFAGFIAEQAATPPPLPAAAGLRSPTGRGRGREAPWHDPTASCPSP